MLFRAPPAAALIVEQLDLFAAVFHRPSATTHLLTEPAPEILDALADRWLDPDALIAALADRYDLAGGRDLLIERLDELVTSGLVERE